MVFKEADRRVIAESTTRAIFTLGPIVKITSRRGGIGEFMYCVCACVRRMRACMRCMRARGQNAHTFQAGKRPVTFKERIITGFDPRDTTLLTYVM